MLNISKISKMLLISGLVLAFSCVTFNANLAYAAEADCDALKKEFENDKKSKEKELKDAEKVVRDAEKEVNKAQNNCDVKLEYCSGYQSAKAMLDKAKRAFNDKKKAYDDFVKTNNAQIVEICNVSAPTTGRKDGKLVSGAIEDYKKDTAAAYDEYKTAYLDKVNEFNKEAEALKKEYETCMNNLDGDDFSCETFKKQWQAKKEATDRELKEFKEIYEKKLEESANAVAAAGNKAEKNEKKSEKLQGKADEASQAAEATQKEKEDKERLLKAAKEDVSKQQDKVDVAQKKMQDTCSKKGDDDPYCIAAKQEYARETSILEEKSANAEKNIKQAEKDLKKAQRKDDKADKKADKAKEKDEKRAQKAYEKAVADMDKYCTLGKATYNAEKCEKATNDKMLAQSDETFQEMHKDKLDAAKKKKEADEKAAAEAKREHEETKTAMEGDISKAAENYVSDAGLIGMQGDLALANKQLTSAEEKRKELEAAQAMACQKPKSKACGEADKKLKEAKAEEEAAKAKAEAAQNAYDQASEKNKAAKASVSKNCSTPEQKASEACLAADVAMKEQDLKDAENNLKKSKSDVTAAEKDLEAAEAAYNEALSAEAIACKDPNSEACGMAKLKLAEASSAKKDAEARLEIAKANVDAYEVAKETAQANLSGAQGAQKAYDDKKAAEAAAAAEEEAKKTRQNEADRICAEKGENSNECATARARVSAPKMRVLVEKGKVKESGFNYSSSASGDVFEMVTRRAANIIVGIKPIVYIFAGFGLIGFAWGAIFNKISWKHFANISIGLFLVANVGRLIEYFVTNGDGGNYYIGQWESSTPKKDKSNELSAAFGDSYHIYSYEMVDAPLNTGGPAVESTRAELEAKAEYSKDKEAPAIEKGDVAQAETSKMTSKERGYCDGSSGSGWANFKSCVKDVVGSVQKAANAVTATIATVNHVANRVEDIKYAQKDIKNSINQMKNGDVLGGLSGILSNVGRIGGAVDSAGSAVVHGADAVLTNVGGIADPNKNQGGGLINTLGEGLAATRGAVDAINNANDRYSNKGNSSAKSSADEAARAAAEKAKADKERSPSSSSTSKNSSSPAAKRAQTAARTAPLAAPAAKVAAPIAKTAPLAAPAAKVAAPIAKVAPLAAPAAKVAAPIAKTAPLAAPAAKVATPAVKAAPALQRRKLGAGAK